MVAVDLVNGLATDIFIDLVGVLAICSVLKWRLSEASVFEMANFFPISSPALINPVSFLFLTDRNDTS